MRVVFVMSTEVGLQTQFLNWREGLTPDSGIIPYWIVIDWWHENGLIERLPFLPNGLKARLRAQIDLRTGLSKGPFDALFVGGHMLHGMRGALQRQPYFITLDATPKQLHDFGKLYGKMATSFRFYEQRKHIGRCDRFQNATALFPWSHWAAQSMIDDYGVDPARVHVIPPGVDLEKWKPACREPHSGPVNILFVGGDFRRKGGDLLLRWADQTASRNWRLHLVTRDPVRTSNPNITVYHGLKPNAPELRALYDQADLFALPTRGDCYSLASIEAMAMGLPVILSCTGGTGDIIQDGVTGYLIEPGDGDAISDRIDYLIAHPAERATIGRAARADVESRYDITKNIAKAVQIMREAIVH